QKGIRSHTAFSQNLVLQLPTRRSSIPDNHKDCKKQYNDDYYFCQGGAYMPKHVHRTAVFTLHTSNQHTRDVLDEALVNYTQAYTAILDFFKDYTAEELHAMS